MKTQSAFPSPGVIMPDGRQQGAYEGMTLRDSIITANGPFDYDEEPVALNAYKMADAMLKERERGE